MITSAEEFMRLRFSEDPGEYRRAATEPADTAVWLEVIDRYPDARIWVAQNKTVPPDVLAVLAVDPSSDVRFMVSMKRKLPSDLLAKLATDSDDSVRLQVARHRLTPRKVLEKLAEDRWETVAEVAAGRLGNS